MRAIVLLSGGLDSTVSAYWARRNGWELIPLSFDYGQRHKVELMSAVSVVEALGVRSEHIIIPLSGATVWGNSALTDRSIEVPDIPEEQIGNEIPSTYVPGRNLIFLSYAFAMALSKNASRIVIGVNSLDYSGYPDCRPEFIMDMEETLQNLANGTGQYVEIATPLIDMPKVGIVHLGTDLGVPFEKTWSCYNPIQNLSNTAASSGIPYYACGKCDSCKIRRNAFRAAGVQDPTPYVR